jgi:hypothetical protein
MKRIIPITFILLFISLSVVAQLEGKYIIDYNLGYQAYTFLEDNKFEYQAFLCTYGEQSKGVYEIENNEITFYYDRDSIPKNIIEIDSFSTNDSIVTLELEVYEQGYNSDLMVAIGTTKDKLWGTETDFEGKLKTTLPYFETTEKLIIDYMFSNVSVPIQKNYNYIIKAYLVSSIFKYPIVDSETLSFKRKGNSIFIKPNYENSKFEEFTKQK